MEWNWIIRCRSSLWLGGGVHCGRSEILHQVRAKFFYLHVVQLLTRTNVKFIKWCTDSHHNGSYNLKSKNYTTITVQNMFIGQQRFKDIYRLLGQWNIEATEVKDETFEHDLLIINRKQPMTPLLMKKFKVKDTKYLIFNFVKTICLWTVCWSQKWSDCLVFALWPVTWPRQHHGASLWRAAGPRGLRLPWTPQRRRRRWRSEGPARPSRQRCENLSVISVTIATGWWSIELTTFPPNILGFLSLCFI